MRWLKQYPITALEVQRELESLQIQHTPESPVGGISPLLRRGMLTFFEDPKNMEALVEHLRVK